MKEIKITSLLLFLLIILSHCAPKTNSIIYHSSERPDIKAVGVIQLHKKADYYDTLFPWLRKNYDSLALTKFAEHFESNSFLVSTKVDYFNPDKEAIKQICREAELDAVLISKIDFTKVVTTLYYGAMPLHTYYDHELQSKLYDKEGNFICQIGSLTYGSKQVRKFKNEAAIETSISNNVRLIHKLPKKK